MIVRPLFKSSSKASLNVRNPDKVPSRYYGDGNATTANAATNTVDIILRVSRYIKIDDDVYMRQV